MDVAIASCLRLDEPDPDAAPLSRALRAADISFRVMGWDDPEANWSAARLTVLRSTWNYPRHRAAFLTWARTTARSSQMWNPLPVIEWNAHKAYLLDLERSGLPIAPTELVEQGSNVPLTRLVERRGWSEVVVKPAVSAASFRTVRFGPDSLVAGERHLRELTHSGDVLVQQYLPSVEDYGERALIWIDGEWTHAVRKTARFENDDESVSQTAVPISSAEAELARRVVDAIDEPLLYARVDVAPGPQGEPVLMELELVEPSLFFNQCPTSLDRFVGAIAKRLGGR